MGRGTAPRQEGYDMSRKAKITTPLKSKATLSLYPTSRKTAIVSGEQLFRLKGGRTRLGLYRAVILEIKECMGAEAGTLQVTVIFERATKVVFFLGWKTKYADIMVGDDPFRIEMT